mmetsp:Transcript_17649/g.28219  ORF Transcript_17649/g.28219 Transcript_17649/m.28219 type:complete len:136 (-) Transcript_17649:269-676(-)
MMHLSPSTTICGTFRTRSRRCVTSTRVLCAIAPMIPLLKMCWATCESTADKGSSKTYKFEFEYTARAMQTRCFCPPDKLMPRSPISVLSPAGRASRSGPRQLTSTALSYRSFSNTAPTNMFSLRVALMTQGCCGT